MSNGKTILDCLRCRNIPQRDSASSNEGHNLPREVNELRSDPYSGLRRCPDCDTFYFYDYEYDPGEPMVPAETRESLVRLTPQRVLLHLSAKQADFAKPSRSLLATGDRLSRQLPKILARFQDATARNDAALPWQIKKYVIETLTDEALARKDWEFFERTLLDSPDPVVRVEAARDFLFVATEEFPVWCVRGFSDAQKGAAQDLLAADKQAREARLVEVFAAALPCQTASYELDSILDWHETTVRAAAFRGLQNAHYRKLDLTPALAALIADVLKQDDGSKSAALELLSQYAENGPTQSARLAQELAARELDRHKALRDLLTSPHFRCRNARD